MASVFPSSFCLAYWSTAKYQTRQMTISISPHFIGIYASISTTMKSLIVIIIIITTKGKTTVFEV
jgi:hypothetical protein